MRQGEDMHCPLVCFMFLLKGHVWCHIDFRYAHPKNTHRECAERFSSFALSIALLRSLSAIVGRYQPRSAGRYSAFL